MASASVLQDPSLQGRLSQTVTLGDGRVLGFAEFGSQSDDSTPLFAFHGLPGSRLESASFHRAGCEVNVRVIGIDRPGLGLSSRHPNRTLLNWPGDVRALARHLSLEKYYVLGVSAGGPYALACAYELSEDELLGVGVVSGMGPWHLGTKGVSLEARVLLNAMAYTPWLARFIMNTIFVGSARDPDPSKMKKTVEGGARRMKPSDREFCGQPEVVEVMSSSLRESFRHGADATVDDARIITSDWGFELGHIRTNKLLLWYGTADCNTPVTSGRYMAERIPCAVLKEYDGDSHFTIHARATEILGDLVMQ